MNTRERRKRHGEGSYPKIYFRPPGGGKCFPFSQGNDWGIMDTGTNSKASLTEKQIFSTGLHTSQESPPPFFDSQKEGNKYFRKGLYSSSFCFLIPTNKLSPCTSWKVSQNPWEATQNHTAAETVGQSLQSHSKTWETAKSPPAGSSSAIYALGIFTATWEQKEANLTWAILTMLTSHHRGIAKSVVNHRQRNT